MTRFSRFALVAALVALPAAAQAQAITGSISASADVATVFNFGAVAPMAFASVIPGASATAQGSIALTRNVGVMYSFPTAGNGKMMLVGGTASDFIQVTFTNCGVDASATAATPATLFTSCTTGNATAAPLAAPAATKTEYVVFNGSIATTAATKPGSYSGTINITATPN